MSPLICTLGLPLTRPPDIPMLPKRLASPIKCLLGLPLRAKRLASPMTCPMGPLFRSKRLDLSTI